MEGSAEHAGESSRGRWRALALWWATHALVGGVARVLFDVSLPAATQSARLAISSADVPLILQLKTVGGMLSKLACGPVLAALGLKRAGMLTLLLVAGNILCVGLPVPGAPEGGPPLLSFAAASVLQSVLQTATWPGTNVLLASWFPASEHGAAWGVMSTAAKAGSIGVTLGVSALGGREDPAPDTGRPRGRWLRWFRSREPQGPTLAARDPADDVQLQFRAVACVMCLWCLVVGAYLRETPPSAAMHSEARAPSAASASKLKSRGKSPSRPDAPSATSASKPNPRGKSPSRQQGAVGRGKKTVHDDAHSLHSVEPRGSGPRDGGGMAPSFLQQLRSTMTQPIFLLGLLVQTTITPIAEFQSQLPLLLARDPLLTSADVSQGTALWHAGVLVAVLVAGRVFDRLSPLARIPLVGLPLLANAALFILVRGASEAVAGRAKLPLVFLLGATHGPANYLIYANIISRRAPRQVKSFKLLKFIYIVNKI